MSREVKNEDQYEKQSAFDEDKKLKMMSKSSNSYTQLVRTITGVESNVIPMKNNK